MMIGSIGLDIIGHVGWETHVLVDKITKLHSQKAYKSLASNILNVKQSVGGSAFFASIACQRMGIPAKVITSVGVGSDEYSGPVLKALQHDQTGIYRIIRRGQTNWFLSLWDSHSGHKRLHCYIRSSLTDHDIFTHHTKGVSAVIFYGIMPAPGQMEELILLYKAQHSLVVLVPNQTLLRNHELLKRLLPSIDLLFLNAAEAVELTNTRTLDNAIKSLSQLTEKSRAVAICLTHGNDGFRLIQANKEVIHFPVQEQIRFALGGGDVLAASTTALFASSGNLVASLTDAPRWSTLTMKDIEPFKIPASTVR